MKAFLIALLPKLIERLVKALTDSKPEEITISDLLSSREREKLRQLRAVERAKKATRG